jgi:hypothetical protein
MDQRSLSIGRTDHGSATFPPLVVTRVAADADEAASILAEDDTADGDEEAEGALVAPISMVLILPTQIEALLAVNGRP